MRALWLEGGGRGVSRGVPRMSSGDISGGRQTSYKASDVGTMVLGTSELQAEGQGSCTLSGTRDCYSYLWPDVYLWRCWESEDLETAPGIFSHKVPSGESPSSKLIVQQ